MLIRLFFRTLAITLLCASAAFSQSTSVSFGGLKADTSLPVELTSDSLEINQADGSAVFSGNVLVKQGKMKLSSARVQAAYSAETKEIQQIIAEGQVLLVNATDAAEADKAVYSIATGEIVMTGNVLLTQGNAAISAQKMTVDLKSGTGRLEGRVTTTFTPGKKK